MTRCLLAIGLVAFVTTPARADDAKTVVEKGLKACGWDKSSSPCMTWKDKGSMTAGGMTMTYTGDWAVQLPDRYRFAIKVQFMGQDLDLTFVFNKDKAFESAAGMTRDVTGEKFEYTKDEMYFMWVHSLAPLLTDKDFRLKDVPGKDVAGKPTACVQVDRDGRPSVFLYFDKASGLLVRGDRKTKNEFNEWKECVDETYMSDWKDIGGGVKAYHKLKVIRDGKPLIESDMSEFKRPEKLDPKLFEKP